MSGRQQKDKNEGMDMRERKEKMKGEARTEDIQSAMLMVGVKPKEGTEPFFKLCPFFGINILLMFDIYI